MQIKGDNYGSPVITLLDSKKGDMGNRVQCAGAHVVNNVSGNLKTTAVIGGAAGLTVLAKKYPAVAKALESPINLVKDGIKNVLPKIRESSAGKEILKAGSEVVKFVKGSPTLLKIATPILLAGIVIKHAFNAGRIEQKYEDRAALNQKLNVISAAD